MKNPREQIIETINNLIQCREVIFEQIVNLAAANEYRSLDHSFESGPSYSFSLKHFKDMKDVNIKNLIKLCKRTEKAIFKIMNLNDIKNNEVNLKED